MKASAANFLSIMKGPKQFVIPIYQRTYSWQIPQCEKLLSDILKISRNTTSPGHFIGSVVYFQESIHTLSDVPQLLVIDGQQRLTTVTLLIAALAEFIRDNAVDIDTNFTKLQNYYLLNTEEDGDLRYKLLLTKRDKETIMNIVKGVKPQNEFSLRIVENFDYFKQQISVENAVTIYNGIQRLFVVDVALEKDKDSPQLIFESLNSTGLDLSQADLIRNYVLMGQDISTQTDLYERFWYPMEQGYGNDYAITFNSFMRDYLSVKTGQIPRIDKVHEEFKSYVERDTTGLTITDIVQDIFKFSGYYVNMVLTKEPDRELNRAFKNITKLKVDVSYPFLLPVYDDYMKGVITHEDFQHILSLVENYVFRRAICGIPTNSLNKTFATLYKTFKKDSYIEGLQAAFQLMDGYKRFPTNAEFEKEITVKDVYNFRSRNYLLSKLENHHRKESVSIDEYTIEHIVPQNPDLNIEWQKMLGLHWKQIQETYLHTLGNLTLTGYNSELSDRSFSYKKTVEGGFNDSPIRLNAFMRATDEWNEEQIKKRAHELATKASSIWYAPSLSADILAKYKPSEDRLNPAYDLSSYDYLRDNMFTLYNALRKRILNIDSSVKEECKARYIAFKSTTNFVDIVPQKARLRLSLNMDFNAIIDPKGICKDVSGLGRWGNGDVELGISLMNELDYAMELIQQAFDEQLSL